MVKSRYNVVKIWATRMYGEAVVVVQSLLSPVNIDTNKIILNDTVNKMRQINIRKL